VQAEALMLDSKPAASRAHIVVNIASLPSTLRRLCRAVRVRGSGAGAFTGAGVCDGTCAGDGAWACPGDGKTIAAHNPISAIVRYIFFMPFAAVLTRASR